MQTAEPEQILYTLDDGIPYVDIKENSDAQIINETGEIISYSNDVSTILFDEDNASAQTVASVELNIYSIEHARIVTGNDHTLMINSDGTVSAWGKNEYGQLGNGTTSNSFDPVQVTGLSNIVEVSAGDGYSIALDQYGDVYSWGRSIGGVLGIGNSANQYIPVKIDTLNNLNIVKISTSGYHCLALTDSGNLYAWGVGYNGQLGTGNTNFENKPTIVQNLPSIIDIGAGGFFSIAVDSAGYVWSWGNNNDCRLGFVSSGDWSLPIKTSIQNIVNIEVGYDHCLALDKSGNVYTWGANNYKQLGNDNITTYTPQKQLVQGLNNISKISTRRHFNFVQDNNENVYAWGRNDFGQLGTGSYNSNSSVPTKISGYGFETITSSIYSAFAVDSDNNLYKWGYMPYNDMSDYNKDCTTVPLKIPLNTVFRQIDARRNGVVAVDYKGDVYTWGEGNYYDLGNNNNNNITYPKKVSGLSNIKMVAKGENHTLALDEDGNVWGMGNSDHGEVGVTYDVITPTKINNINNVSFIAAGEGFSAAIKNDGTVWTWGEKGKYLGYEADGNVTVPRQVPGLSNVVKIVCANRAMIALTSDSKLYTWGNRSNLLGVGASVANATPQLMNGVYKDVSCSSRHALAIDNNNALCGWGSNGSGQLGEGKNSSRQDKSLPIYTQISSPIDLAFAGYNHSLASYNGHLYSWGEGRDGQLGYKVYGSQLEPKEITDIKNPSMITGGGEFSVIIDENNDMWTFGNNKYGQLAVISNVPQKLIKSGSQPFLSAEDISNNYLTQGIIAEIDSELTYKFVPKTSNTYIFTTVSNMDTVGYLYDCIGNQIDYNDDGNGYGDFKISQNLIAGNTYYIKVKGYGDETGSYSLYIETPLTVEIR